MRQNALDLALRAWAPVFPQMKEAVPGFVYNAFYPDGWQTRQNSDLAQVLDDEPETVDVALVDGVMAGWVCTRIHPEDSMGEVYVTPSPLTSSDKESVAPSWSTARTAPWMPE